MALVHDYLVTMGGAERVFLSICRAFPDAPIYTSIYRAETALPEFSDMDVRPLWSSRLPLNEASYRRGVPAYLAAFSGLRLSDFDVVIASSSAFAKNAGAGAGKRLWYCYTPPRFLWPCGESSRLAGRAEHVLRGPAGAGLRWWDRRVARRYDRILAISSEVRDRVERFYGMPAAVLHPPISPGLVGPIAPGERSGYLVVSRLNRYKSVDVAIEACRVVGAPLTIIGRGEDEARLRELAGGAVRFLGRISDAELRDEYQRAKAVIVPGEEDWGLTPIEANAHGTPAIAAARGGALETVVDGLTGVLYRPFGVEPLAAAIRRSASLEFKAVDLQRHVDGFSETSFQDKLRAEVESVVSR